MREPKYLSEYLDNFIEVEKDKAKTSRKISWKHLLILLLPFGTLLLLGFIILKKINKTTKPKT